MMTVQTPARVSFRGIPILRAARRWCGVRLADLLRTCVERDVRYRAARRLETLEEHLLRDIGLTRDDVRGRRP
jgi:uncharacterized protein YjiS (DUF1127 family)